MEELTWSEFLSAMFPSFLVAGLAFSFLLFWSLRTEWEDYKQARTCSACSGNGQIPWKDSDARGMSSICYCCHGKGWIGSVCNFATLPLQKLAALLLELKRSRKEDEGAMGSGV